MKTFIWLFLIFVSIPVFATDHNEPNSLNTIFSDVKPDAADLYGLFGYPVVHNGVENLVVMMTFQPAPAVSQYDNEVFHQIHLDPDRRPKFPDFKWPDAIDHGGRVTEVS